MNLHDFFSSLTERTFSLINKCLFGMLLVLFILQQDNAFAQTNIIGNWYYCNNDCMDGNNSFIEYDFKDNSLVTISYISETDNYYCRYVSNLSIDGTYSAVCDNITINLDMSTLDVSILKYKMHEDDEMFSEDSIKSVLESMAQIFMKKYEYLSYQLVTDDNPDVVILIPLNADSSKEIRLSRAVKSKEDLFDFNPNYETNLAKYSLYLELIINVIVYGFIISIVYLLILILKFLFRKSISRYRSSSKNVIVRRIYYNVRFILKIYILITIGRLYVLSVIDSIAINEYIAIIIILGGGGILLNVLSSLSLPVNILTIKKFMKRKRNFSLYLRGFVTDDYTPELSDKANAISTYRPWNNIGVKKTEVNYNLFPLSEKELAKACKKISPLYSVGLPEELESPEGAKRIYLDNDTWQDEALTLMKSAKFIIVNIHPNTNCLWEIKVCNSHFSEKTVYFIDDLEKLEFVKDKMGEDLPRCLTSDEIKHNHVAVYCNNEMVMVQPYVNTYLGIRSVILLFNRIIK